MNEDLYKIFCSLYRRKLLVLTICAASLGLGYYYYKSAETEFEASTLLIVRGNHVDGNDQNAVRDDNSDEVLALAQIATTDDVISQAITKVGAERLLPRSKPEQPIGLDYALRAGFGTLPGAPTSDNRAVLLVRRGMFVKSDAKASVVTIGFRFRDAEVCATLVNAIAQALIDRQLDLWGPGGNGEFFERQKEKFDEELQSAVSKLTRFSVENALYSVDEQRTLLLKKYNDIASAYASTESQLSQRNAEKRALTAQLLKLKPVTQSNYVTGIVESLGSKLEQSENVPTVNNNPNQTPPLLLIKVYQDSMVDLLRINSTIEGLTATLSKQEEQIGAVNRELQHLAQMAGEFQHLKTTADLTAINFETYAKRVAEEAVNQDIAKHRLSTVKVAQAAVTPWKPVWPSFGMIFIASVLGGLLMSVAMISWLDRKAIADWIRPAEKPALPHPQLSQKTRTRRRHKAAEGNELPKRLPNAGGVQTASIVECLRTHRT